MMNFLKLLKQKIFNKLDWRKDMMIKLYAIHIVKGTYPWKKLPFSQRIKDLIKEEIRLMVEDEALVAELTKED